MRFPLTGIPGLWPITAADLDEMLRKADNDEDIGNVIFLTDDDLQEGATDD